MESARVISRVVNMAVEAVWAFKVRSMFVILGVAFGISSLTLIVTAVDGANRKAHEIVGIFGPDAALVFGGDISKRAMGMRSMTLSLADADRIRQSLPGAAQVVPMRSVGNITIKYHSANYDVDRVIGATDNYAESWDWPLAEGRDISPEDVERGAKVCLMGSKPSRELFGEESPVGKVVFINGIPTQVVGRLVFRGVSGGGGDIDNRIIMPLTTLTQRFNLDRKYVAALRIRFLRPEYMKTHVENLRSLLRKLHNLSDQDDDDFTILTADEVLNFLAMLKGGLLVFLSITATIAVLVGGFVLANLFSISVSERSQEIGLKKALGARNSSIMLQFLVEASILTLIGGLVGLFLGLGLGQMLTRLEILTIQFSWKAFFISLVSALAIGLIFGLKPASQAATLDPIQALQGGE
ncbi:MAG: ABC transporter permease [Proteobacteria bacterium]|nr:ABC transporter permease [Pseudomonadota bacterium]MBU1612096.1 ABC transporter permease [Pseudomonadota bacterium]